MDAAAVAFVRSGYHNTLISQIVAEAGVGQGTFYRYFTDKRHIFAEMMEEFFQTLLSPFGDMSQQLPTNVEEYHAASLRAIITSSEILDEHTAIARLFIREGPSIDPDFAQRMEQIYGSFAALAQHFLEHAIAQGFARPYNPAVIGQCLVGMGLRLVDTTWGDGVLHHLNKKEMIEQAIEFAFRGIGNYQHPTMPGAGTST